MLNNFRVLLAKKKLNMQDVVRETGLSKNTVRALFYETGKGVQFETIEKVCRFLECEISDLFELKKEDKENESIKCI